MIAELNNKMIDVVAGGEKCFCMCFTNKGQATDKGIVNSAEECEQACPTVSFESWMCNSYPNTPVKKPYQDLVYPNGLNPNTLQFFSYPSK
jgi:hypothetical protein